MKILYISKAETADFLCDTLFHGLRTVLGPDAVDVNRMWFLYDNGFPNGVPWHTFYGLLPDIEVDRTDILQKIRAKYFDYIFYGSIHRCRTFLPEVLQVYSQDRVVFIDGEDDCDHFAFEWIAPQNIFYPEPVGYTVPKVKFYFKRELSSKSRAIPIQFSIPREKIIMNVPEKIRFMAPMDPRDSSSYKYPDQESYFKQYSESYFGVTMKKGGWDCARHYEILAAGCVPYFIGIEDCPEGTLTFLPKSDLIQVRLNADLAGGQLGRLTPSIYREVYTTLRRRLFDSLTTQAMAMYMISKLLE